MKKLLKLKTFNKKLLASLLIALTLSPVATGCRLSTQKEIVTINRCEILPPLPESEDVKKDITIISVTTFNWIKQVTTTQTCLAKKTQEEQDKCFNKFLELENATIQ